jgi:hypothetical protein
MLTSSSLLMLPFSSYGNLFGAHCGLFSALASYVIGIRGRFLHFWSSDVLAAWLVLYAVGNLALMRIWR